ncbi:hypothetical protein J3A64_004832 [Pseudarthrobacter sp. PvP004]|nr:hypothetical protein [Pseudarthrobacter sp. PvP004]
MVRGTAGKQVHGGALSRLDVISGSLKLSTASTRSPEYRVPLFRGLFQVCLRGSTRKVSTLPTCTYLHSPDGYLSLTWMTTYEGHPQTMQSLQRKLWNAKGITRYSPRNCHTLSREKRVEPPGHYPFEWTALRSATGTRTYWSCSRRSRAGGQDRLMGCTGRATWPDPWCFFWNPTSNGTRRVTRRDAERAKRGGSSAAGGRGADAPHAVGCGAGKDVNALAPFPDAPAGIPTCR